MQARSGNLRTVIVTADIHQGLYQSAFRIAAKHGRYLTFWHWSGVTLYTSSYEFAGSCVFDKQLPEILLLQPHAKRKRHLTCDIKLLTWQNFALQNSAVNCPLLSVNCSLCFAQGKPYSEVTAAFLPSSLGKFHSFALLYSSWPPVSVCGTDLMQINLEIFLGGVLCPILRKAQETFDPWTFNFWLGRILLCKILRSIVRCLLSIVPCALHSSRSPWKCH